LLDLIPILRKCPLIPYHLTLALDDFEYSPEWDPLLEIAHIVKFDVQAMSFEELQRDVDHIAKYDVRLLAEKVETNAEF